MALVGLVQIVPVVGLFMPAGHLIDRLDRRKILMCAMAAAALWSLGLAYCSATAAPVVWIYLFLFLVGVSRTFMQPARAAFLPQIVPRRSSATPSPGIRPPFNFHRVVGPALAGVLIAWLHHGTWIYGVTAGLALANCGCLAMIRSRPFVPSSEPVSLRSLAAGLSFVWRTKVMLGAITLDMFAVLLGRGHGPPAGIPGGDPESRSDGISAGCGPLPGIGAVCMSFVLAHRPPLKRRGPGPVLRRRRFRPDDHRLRRFAVFSAVAGAAAAARARHDQRRHSPYVGAALTPDDMRGRVSAVNGMFIGISNELGEFESGIVAHVFDRSGDRSFGPTVSAVSGGIGTLAVVGVVAVVWPQLRNYGRLDGAHSSEKATDLP